MATKYWEYEAGESVFSLVTHFHIGEGHHDWKQTNLALFGRTHVRLHPLLSGNLNQLSAKFNVPVHTLLNHATAYPLYAMSLRDSADGLRDVLCSSSGQRLTLESRQAAFALPLPKSYKYCPQCTLRDLDKLGKTPWWMVHQLYGVNYCPFHTEPLFEALAGEGGINRRYILPGNGVQIVSTENERAAYLSVFVHELFSYLQLNPIDGSLSDKFRLWLDIQGFLTAGGHLRMRQLSSVLRDFWRPVFESTSVLIPLELSTFSYIPTLVHREYPVHYLKIVLLMAFLVKHPKQFFDACSPKKSICTPDPLTVAVKEDEVLCLLNMGYSMRQISHRTKHSIATIKQIALRNGMQVNRRRHKLNVDIERDIWRKALVGLHRQEIATFHGVSVGAVEQIIQSHKGLSEWRHHLLMAQRKQTNRQLFLETVDKNPQATRNELKNSTSCYMWLYKNDKDWLYARLPEARRERYYPAVNWTVRDSILAFKMANMVKPADSVSAIDRQFGGHGWLTHQADKLPLTVEAALNKIKLFKGGC